MKKIRLNDIILYLLLLTPILTLLQGISIFTNINKIFLGLVSVLLFTSDILHLTKKSIIIFIITMFVWVVSLLNINIKYLNVNELFYFLIWIFFFVYISFNYSYLISKIYDSSKFLKYEIYIWCILVAISLLIPSSFSKEWGNAVYFKSFADNQFRFATTCFFIATLIGLYVKITKKKLFLSFLLVPFLGIAASGSRTYLLLIIMLILPIYYKNTTKRCFYISLVPLTIILCVLISNSNMMDKIKYVNTVGVLNGRDYLSTLTSGRLDFWQIDFNEFMDFSIFEKIIGRGVTYVREVNAVKYNLTIQAHNDYLNLLVSHGFLGLFLYLYVFFKFIRLSIRKNVRISTGSLFVFILIYFINAMINGVLYYIGIVFSLPMILLLFSSENKSYKGGGKIELYENKSSLFVGV